VDRFTRIRIHGNVRNKARCPEDIVGTGNSITRFPISSSKISPSNSTETYWINPPLHEREAAILSYT